ncbi:MAG: KOW domain-containing RNA-binding protein [Clostridia bacterium]
MELGQVVFSIAGRDRGKYFAVIEVVDGSYVKIADGDSHRIKTSKLKKVKHLHTKGDVLEKLAEKLKNGIQVFDTELSSALRFYKENAKQ